MKTLLMSLAAACLVVPMTLVSVGCSHEVAHEDRVSTNPLTGSQTHHENTVYKNADGSYSSEQSTEKVR